MITVVIMYNLSNLQRIKKSNNKEQAIKDFLFNKNMKNQDLQPQVLGAGKIGACRYQSIKNITNWLGLAKEEEEK